jgi:AmiR/NasT family two-component response regulator
VADVGSTGTRTSGEQLEQALQSSRIIGAAIGIVMATRVVDYDGALQLLKARSNRTNVKLRDLCAEIVDQAPSRRWDVR